MFQPQDTKGEIFKLRALFSRNELLPEIVLFITY